MLTAETDGEIAHEKMVNIIYNMFSLVIDVDRLHSS